MSSSQVEWLDKPGIPEAISGPSPRSSAPSIQAGFKVLGPNPQGSIQEALRGGLYGNISVFSGVEGTGEFAINSTNSASEGSTARRYPRSTRIEVWHDLDQWLLAVETSESSRLHLVNEKLSLMLLSMMALVMRVIY